jgi:hypothetical protein
MWWLPRGIGALVCALAAAGVAACGQSSRLVTYEEFRSIREGASQADVERKLGPPKARWSNWEWGTCLGWDRVGQRPIAGKPAFTICFKHGTLASKGILDPNASD